MPQQVADKVLVWGSDLIEPNTIEQVKVASRLPFVPSHIALMPDAHVGRGSTVGSVVPTKGAVIPATVGVDLGCGMIARKLDLKLDELPDLERLMPLIEEAIPAGVGKGHRDSYKDSSVNVEKALGWTPTIEEGRGLKGKAISQCGTLGSGNHFFEICVDQESSIWVVLHSGSRGIGNILASRHIDIAKKNMKKYFIDLEDQDLAYLVQGEDDFKAYIEDMLWAQDYAMLNREVMMKNALAALDKYLSDHGLKDIRVTQAINCHHNFTQQENHGKKNLWITRKGAVKAAKGDMVIIPGSMGTETFIAEGLGNPASYNSCSHGAGRVLSRGAAKRELTATDLKKMMKGKVWNRDRAQYLIDESPDAYKDVNAVMAAQADLVEVRYSLRQIFNYKG